MAAEEKSPRGDHAAHSSVAVIVHIDPSGLDVLSGLPFARAKTGMDHEINQWHSCRAELSLSLIHI